MEMYYIFKRNEKTKTFDFTLKNLSEEKMHAFELELQITKEGIEKASLLKKKVFPRAVKPVPLKEMTPIQMFLKKEINQI